jgi:hypothetical protein
MKFDSSRSRTILCTNFFYKHSNSRYAGTSSLDLVFNLPAFYFHFLPLALKGDNFVIQAKTLLLLITLARTGTGGLWGRGDIFYFAFNFRSRNMSRIKGKNPKPGIDASGITCL